MLVGAVAAAAFVANFGAPEHTCPEDIATKGFALVFAETPSQGFELFYKDPGLQWSAVPELNRAVEDKRDQPWLVFHLGTLDADYAVSVAIALQKLPKADGAIASDFDGYFSCDPLMRPETLNNFGLHDIY